ncbi:ABC transporter ATP-binding protein [Parafrigoribacterium soli]|uniref:ABC transporter ATP-binding protein n=1 Tax=Parafrigoribacterium soli TaxID=3144663 RepID=UPI0032EEF488
MSGDGLLADFTVERPGFSLALSLQVPTGRTVALLGPNGAGKSSALRAIAGLVRPASGSIRLDGTTFDDPTVHLDSERRRVGFVFQDYLLFPHLSSLENVAFGLRATGVPKEEARDRAMAWLDRVGLARFAEARPAQLSGGQAQRVALARALVGEPRLLLLDEPLAALDASVKAELRTELASHLREYDGCAVVVTHDALDALVLGDELVVIENGSVVQRGAPLDVARAPQTDYVARLMGLNLVDGEAFAPSAVTVQAAPDANSRWQGTVASIEQQLDTVRVTVRLDSAQQILADLSAAEVAELRLAPAAGVWLAVGPTKR